MKIYLKESQLTRLLEGGGIHSDGQIDLFLDPGEMDTHRDMGNRKFLDTLKSIERECGWKHDDKNDEETPTSIIHKCYPAAYMSIVRSVPRGEFVRRLSEKIPAAYLKTSYSETDMRPDDWFVDVILKKV